MTEQNVPGPLQSMRRMIVSSSLLLLAAVLTAYFWFDLLTAWSVLLGGLLIVGNLVAFTWMAARWWKQRKVAVAVALFFKLWVSLGILFVLLSFAPVSGYGVVAGMGCVLVSLLLQASAEVKHLSQESSLEEGGSDA